MSDTFQPNIMSSPIVPPLPSYGRLPDDILILIASHLDNSPNTLRAFAQTSWRCYDAAAPLLYRQLWIGITTRENLARDATWLRKSAAGRQYLRYARRLELDGTMRPTAVADVSYTPAGAKPLSRPKVDALEPCFDGVFVSDSPLDNVNDAAEAWKPLVSLIADFSRLADLVFQGDDRFPPGLLEALDRYHPLCRLHLREFRFKSLHDPVTDPGELALAMSPHLHSLSVLYTWRDSYGQDDFNGEAVCRVLSLAPKLKHLYLLECQPASSPWLQQSLTRPRAPWKGFLPPVNTRIQASLETLSHIAENDPAESDSVPSLYEWQSYTDFSKLRALVLRRVRTAALLGELTSKESLPSLEQLVISLEPMSDDDSFQQTYRSVAEAFFDSLRPLQVLRLRGAWWPSLLKKIVTRHGPSLRELVVNNPHTCSSGPQIELTGADVSLITTSCPLLTDLELTIRRTRGSGAEILCYEAIGSMQNLQHLILRLDCTTCCSIESPSDEWDDFQRQGVDRIPHVYQGHIEAAVINMAVDEALARSIWDLVSPTARKRSLRSLEILPFGGTSVGRMLMGDIADVYTSLSRSYRLTVPKNGSREDLVIVEPERQQREETTETYYGDKPLTRCVPDLIVKIFNRLWGIEAEEKGWRDAWSSLPLQRSNEGNFPLIFWNFN